MNGKIKIQNDNVCSCKTVGACYFYVWNDRKINLCMISNCSSSNDLEYSTAIVLRCSNKNIITQCNIILDVAKIVVQYSGNWVTVDGLKTKTWSWN